MLARIVEVAATGHPDAKLVRLGVGGVLPYASQQGSRGAVVNEDFCPAGADHRLLPRDPRGVAEMDYREQAPVGVSAALAGELQRDDLAGSD